MSYNTEELVAAYIAIRSERERLTKEYEAKDRELEDDMQKIKVELLKVCNDVGADTIRTQQGTVMRKLNERFYCSDWDVFRKFVVENSAVELLERRIAQGNFKQFMSEHQGDGLPPGVNVMREFDVTVRKPTSSSVVNN
jgi:hypothetical protein